jgi:hypothetical protein
MRLRRRGEAGDDAGLDKGWPGWWREGETMTNPQFDKKGIDKDTFAPVKLVNQLDSKWKDVRLSFDAWDWLHGMCGGDTVEGYYLNGYGVQGLVMACRLHAGLSPEAEGIHYDSEGDTCFIHFSRMEDAIETARLASEMFKDRSKVVAMIAVARANGLED